MKVLIVGAGAVGSVLAGLLRRKKGTAVTCATNDIKAARPFMTVAGKGVSLVRADASDAGSIVRVARGADLIINTSLPIFNLRVIRAALAVRANYLDLDSQLKDLRHAEQLMYDGMFRRAGLVGLINAGVSPGLSNLMAADAADRLPTLTTLKFRLLEEQRSDVHVPTWSTKVLNDALTSRPLIYRRGEFGFSRPLADQEMFAFPKPYGKRRVISIYGDEVATVPLYLKVRNVDYKVGGGDVESALDAGHRRATPAVPNPQEMRRLVREKIVRHARLIVSVEASGGGIMRMTHAVFPELREIMRRVPGATYIGYPTALCAAAFIGAFPSIGKKGVFPAEALPQKTRRSVLAELRRHGVAIRI